MVETKGTNHVRTVRQAQREAVPVAGDPQGPAAVQETGPREPVRARQALTRAAAGAENTARLDQTSSAVAEREAAENVYVFSRPPFSAASHLS